MDNRFADFYGIMQYFLGYQGDDAFRREGEAEAEAEGKGGRWAGDDGRNRVEGRDEVAGRIAEAGQDWAAKVLRREDMQVYVLRLLLEYARVSDGRRDVLGYVADLRR